MATLAVIIFALAVAAALVLGWLSGITGVAVFLTLAWLLVALFAAYWIGVVPAGQDGSTWLGFAGIACGGLVVIWLPNRLRAR